MKQIDEMTVAVTGGIGSGKSVMCRRFERRGIRVYDCDASAKRLMADDESLKKQLCALVSPDLYDGGKLQKRLLAEFILQSNSHKQAVNDIVHPAVAADFMSSGYHWLESAILFESAFDRRVPFDCVVCVVAPLELRVQRIMERDGLTRGKALEWINRQMPQEEIVKKSNYCLVSGRDDIEQQVDDMLADMQSRYCGKD